MKNDLIKKYSVKIDHGSGILFQPNSQEYTYILTAKHVLQKEDSTERGEKMMIYKDKVEISTFIPNKEKIIHEIELKKTCFIHENEKIDIAILKVNFIEGYNNISLLDKYANLSGFLLSGFPIRLESTNTIHDQYTNQKIKRLVSETDINLRVELSDTNLGYSKIVGFSGGGIVKESENNIILVGIQSEVKSTLHADGQIDFVPIKYFNEIIEFNSNSLSEMNIFRKSTSIMDGFYPSIEWARKKIEVSLSSIGDRYITYNKKELEELNHEVPIEKYFKYLTVGEDFDFDKYIDRLLHDSNYQEAIHYMDKTTGVQKFLKRYEKSNDLETSYLEDMVKDYTISEELKIGYVYFNYQHNIKIILEFYRNYEKLIMDLKKIKSNRGYFLNKDFIENIKNLRSKYSRIIGMKEIEDYMGLSTPYSIEKIYKIYRRAKWLYERHINDLVEFVLENKFHDNKSLSSYLFKHTIIIGEAMTGKTHLLSDIAHKRIELNKPTILVYAQNFKTSEDPIKQIIEQLELNSYNLSNEEFLERINNWGKESNSEVFLIVDAVNEVTDKSIWKNNFIRFIKTIKSYKNIVLLLSIRDAEKSLVFNEDINYYIKNNMIEIPHDGFDSIEYSVLKKFCDVFKIEMPSFPLTSPILSNPGLLFLFFTHLKNQGKTTINQKVLKPNFIITEYIKDVNKRFKDIYNLNDRKVYVHKTTNIISQEIVENNFEEEVNYEETLEKTIKIHEQILDFLISEGIFLTRQDEFDELYIYFSYQRFGNYFFVIYLFSLAPKERVFEYLSSCEIIKNLFKNYINHKAIVEALIIKASEDYNIDFADIYPEYFESTELNKIRYNSFNKSLNLPTRITNSFSNLFNLNENDKYDSLKILLNKSLETEDEFNFYRLLHPLLKSMEINKRDYHWSISINSSYVENGIVEKLIHWAWDKKVKYELDNESLYLYGITLSWFLISSNRKLRDSATKALVNLFTNNLEVFLKVLKEFADVTDLYILERLYAVAYGTVLRSIKTNGFKELGMYIYDTIFNVSFVIEHILIREYASFTVEYINKHHNLGIELEKIYPPYNQNNIWTLPEIEKNEVEKYRSEYRSIYASTQSLDFKIYKVYSFVNHFLNIKISDRPHPKTPQERRDVFFSSLTNIQKEAYDAFNISGIEIMKQFEKGNIDIEKLFSSNKDSQKENDKEIKFKKLLTPEQLKEYDEVIFDFSNIKKEFCNIDIKSIKRLIFLETIKFGWKEELFGDFEREIKSISRHEHEIERIGKKYQWIALHEVLARLLDNYEYKDGRSRSEISKYIGAFQFSVRDIDPTSILKQGIEEDTKWWFNVNNEFEDLKISDIEWMNSNEKLPKISQLVDLKKNDTEYLLLDMNFSIDGNKDKQKYRNLYYSVNSFIIEKNKIKEFKDFAQDKSFYAKKMPNSSDFYDAYIREYPNSKAYEYLNNDYYQQPDWDDSFKDSEDRLPSKVLKTSTAYLNEGTGYDLSLENSIKISLPSKWIIEQMNLKQTLNDGEWVNDNNEVVFFDPTINTSSISIFSEKGVLIANKKILADFLYKNGYTILWIIWGEKQVRDSSDDFNDDFNDEDFLGISEIDSYSYLEGNKIIETEINCIKP